MIRFFVIALIVLFPSGLRSEPYTPKNLPRCTVSTLKSGKTACAYTLEQVKAVYDADSRLTECVKVSELTKKKLFNTESIVSKLKKQVTLSSGSVTALEKRQKELTKLLLKTDLALQRERVKPRWGSYIAWGVTVAVSAAFAGYVIADRLR